MTTHTVPETSTQTGPATGPTTGPAATMDVGQVLTGARDAITVRRVFGDPIERDGVTIIPAATVRGGGGGGGGSGPNDEDGTPTGTGSGAGFGVAAHPAGAFVVRGGNVAWEPAVDRQRIVLATLALAAVVVLSVRSVLVRR
jgi:uncharacterized spore protein YtfJ